MEKLGFKGWDVQAEIPRRMGVYSPVIAREYDKGNWDVRSRNEKETYFMLSNNKFLGKC